MKPSPDSSFAPFRNRLFLAYWLTGLSANFGWLIQLVGASWLMTAIGGSPEMIALVQTSIALPIVMFALMAGSLADSLGRKRMVMVSQSFLLVVSVALAMFAYFGMLTPVLLLVFTFMLGCGKALHNPGWQTLVSEFMTREELPAAISLNSVGFNIARTVGPAIGGLIVALVGAFAAFVVSALSNVGMLVVFARWKGEAPRRDLPPERVGAAMMSGLRYVAMSPHILLVLVRTASFTLAGFSVMSLFPLIARDLLGGGPNTFGFLLGAFGFGAVGGAFLRPQLARRLSAEGVVRAGFLFLAAAVAVIALSRWLPLTLLASAAGGCSWLVVMSTFNSMVQVASPRWVVSRCLALYHTAVFGGNALGSWIWGLVAGAHGTDVSLLVSAGALLAGAAIGLRFPVRNLHALDLDPLSRWKSPEFGVDVLPQSGPILTVVQYSIRPDDIEQFLAAMAERRRSRTRDGARRWTLARDIENPELWFERFQTPTWVETVRHHQRRTVADYEVAKRINELNKDGKKPIVRYELVRQPGWRGPQDMPLHPDLHHQ